MATTQGNPEATAEKQPTEQEQLAQRELAKPTPAGRDLLEQVVSEGRFGERDALIIRRAELDYKQRLARLFAKAGCFKDIDKDDDGAWLPEEVSIARAMVKIELGESMGFTPAESMTGIDIIKGRPAIGASLRAARMQKAGYSWPQMVLTDTGCWMPLMFKGEPMLQQKLTDEGVPITVDGKPVMMQVVVSFAEKDAKLLGLIEKNQSMYKKDPSSMYFARAVTRAQRRYGAGVLSVDILDTYEAREIPPSPNEEATRILVDHAISGIAANTKQAAEAVANAKIAELEKQRTEKGCAPGETPEQRNARIERQIAEHEVEMREKEAAQNASQKPQETAQQSPKEEPKHFATWDAWEQAGAPIHPVIIIEGGENAGTYQDVDGNYQLIAKPEPPKPTAAKRTAPVFGRKGQ